MSDNKCIVDGDVSTSAISSLNALTISFNSRLGILENKQIISGATGQQNVLTASGTNNAIGQSNLTFNNTNNTLSVGSENVGSLDTYNMTLRGLNNIASNKYLVMNTDNTIGLSTGGNYAGATFRETASFNFAGANGTPGTSITSETDPVVFFQPPQLGISTIFITYLMSSSTTTCNATINAVEGVVVNKILSQSSLVSGPYTLPTNLNITTQSLALPSVLSSGSPRRVAIRLSPSGQGNLTLFNIIVGFTAV